IQILAYNWIKEYQKNPSKALIDWMQFVVEASGSRYLIPKDTAMPFSHREILISATLQFRNVSMFYPMIRKTGDSFVQTVGAFVKKLVQRVAKSNICNQDFLREVSGIVLACSESKVRPFRHTSTMIGLKLLSTFNKLPLVRGGDLERMWLDMFQSLFVDRCRDVVENIRLMCLSELGSWLVKYPESYLQPQSLRFLFEALQDDSTKVRECSLNWISCLSRKKELRSVCLDLGEEFKRWFLHICVDQESELGELSLHILTDLYSTSSGILNEEECRMLEQLMFAANRGLAQAAGKFFNLRRRRRRGDGENTSQEIRNLLNFFMSFGEHEHAAYLVDALYESSELILDWQVMVRMLLEDQSPELSQQESSALIEILSKGVKQAILGEIPPGRYTRNLVRKPKKGAQQLATQILAPVMHSLLDRYSQQAVDVENLLELPQHLDVGHYMVEENQHQLLQLIERIKNIMFQKTQIAVLHMGARTLGHLYRIHSSEYHIQEVLSNAVTNYKIALRNNQECLSSSFSASESSSTSQSRRHSRRLLVTLRLVSTLYGHFDLSSFHLTESVLASLKRLARDWDSWGGRDNLSHEAQGMYLEVCYFSLTWDLKKVRSQVAGGSDEEDSCAALKKNLEDFLYVGFSLISRESNQELGCQAFALICDLLVLFGDHLHVDASSDIHSLIYQLTINELELLENFLMQYVFSDNPEELMKEHCFDERQRKRRILTSYCKLVAFNVMPSMRASLVFQYYERYHAPFGDILRAVMERSLAINSVHYGMTILHTCLLVYKIMMSKYNGQTEVVFCSKEFAELIRLAKRLAETWSSNLLENRPSILTLHRAGIMFVMEVMPNELTTPPENLLFLSVLQEFVPQVLLQDRMSLLMLLQRIEQPALPSCLREEWQPLDGYRSALESKK
ncbi:hypothetical protein KR009_004357, partial [Drosophila setifemur]